MLRNPLWNKSCYKYFFRRNRNDLAEKCTMSSMVKYFLSPTILRNKSTFDVCFFAKQDLKKLLMVKTNAHRSKLITVYLINFFFKP